MRGDRVVRRIGLYAMIVPWCIAVAQNAPTVDELVAKNVAARGGAEKMKAIRTARITAKGVTAEGVEAPITVYIKRPGLMRSESTVQGESIVQAFDGKQSWSVNPLMGSGAPTYGSEQESRNASERAASQLDGHLADYKAKGSKVEFQGKEYVEGSQAYKLKITTKDGSVIYDYLDEKTYLDIKTVLRVIQGGVELEVTSYPSNYKPVAGVMVPLAVDQRIGTLPAMKMVIEKVEVNVPLPDSLFQFPKKP
jgi:outer membrane lipoprotein-sorting protein